MKAVHQSRFREAAQGIPRVSWNDIHYNLQHKPLPSQQITAQNISFYFSMINCSITFQSKRTYPKWPLNSIYLHSYTWATVTVPKVRLKPNFSQIKIQYTHSQIGIDTPQMAEALRYKPQSCGFES